MSAQKKRKAAGAPVEQKSDVRRPAPVRYGEAESSLFSHIRSIQEVLAELALLRAENEELRSQVLDLTKSKMPQRGDVVKTKGQGDAQFMVRSVSHVNKTFKCNTVAQLNSGWVNVPVANIVAYVKPEDSQFHRFKKGDWVEFDRDAFRAIEDGVKPVKLMGRWLKAKITHIWKNEHRGAVTVHCPEDDNLEFSPVFPAFLRPVSA
eukprot:CAMPEP_0183352954 /NCGR_PEP_ID=MMETSP0164_2-20130417/31769_1 /TAXON_ID=221442 /ORGANISM="Coccolithus pelagicus ssp braarudi, Strain PLY182g" /LENGTH=205 /DNA_ID=CAMNT_0025525531 /DNA_START=81 /DNA_END=698 /DNA_ORIENTATION=+